MIPALLRLEGSLGGDFAMERVRGAGMPGCGEVGVIVGVLTLALTVAEGCGHDEGV